MAAIVWLVLVISRRDRSSEPSSAREILDRRYANGEIDEKTYDRMKRDLK
ncbi:SHOCT domain-containing protein [Guyparkeria halopsychrophila]